jgi:hypothetical protein
LRGKRKNKVTILRFGDDGELIYGVETNPQNEIVGIARYKEIEAPLDEDNPVWVDNRGKEIPLSRMSERHLRFCLEYCQNNAPFRKEWIPVLERELKKKNKRYIQQNLYFDNFEEFI